MDINYGNLTLTVEKLIMDESPITPEKEITYREVIKLLEEINASQREENAM